MKPPVEEHAALTAALGRKRAEADRLKMRHPMGALLAVLDVLIETLPKHPPVIHATGPTFCKGCSFTHWTHCPIVCAARAAVGAS